MNTYIIIFNFTQEEFVDELNKNNKNNNISSADRAAFYLGISLCVTEHRSHPSGKYNNIKHTRVSTI